MQFSSDLCSCVKEFHELFGAIMFLEIIQSVALLSGCVMLILFTGGDESTYLLIGLKISYLFAQLCEIGGYCYLGNEISYAVGLSTV